MSIWQTKSWQEMLLKSKQIEKIIEIDNVFIEKRSIGLGQFGLFVLGVNKQNIDLTFLDKVKSLCKNEKSLFIQFETIDYHNNLSLNLLGFTNNYYKKFITPYTAIIDLSLGLDDILSLMKPKGRYNIRLAEKKGVIVKEVEKTKENVEIFYNLMLETTSRDNFNGNSLDYYISFLSSIKESKLFIAYYEEKAISAGIFTFFGEEAIYYYGASTSDANYRNLMSPYLLQWTAICKAKELDCKIYDFLGVASSGEESSHLRGVTDFKSKFTANIIKVSESYIFINSKFKYSLLQLLRKIKR
ncbi:MAG: peptidoglycan bridge formation glycyltransferase FemA/FemB family protein [Candidatus Gracilibacteria bacterium]|nr:peptidoglycan bridge formation glycyltransferase FemA/FemB family protein [Candidatus Gracilibacteria bacterium]